MSVYGYRLRYYGPEWRYSPSGSTRDFFECGSARKGHSNLADDVCNTVWLPLVDAVHSRTTMCKSCDFPLLASPLSSVSTSFDGNQSWAGVVTIVTTMPSSGNPNYFGGVGYAKLVVGYTIVAEECVSQGSWTINQNHNESMALMMPEGKTLVGFDTFATEIPPLGVNLVPCDVYNAPGVYPTQNNCQGVPGKIGFIPILIKEFGMQADSTANSRGVEFVCSNAKPDYRRGCMARVRYK